MGKDRVRYFVTKKNANATLRFYWQPDDELAGAGWPQERLPGATEADRATAAAAAMAINARIDAWRRAGSPRRATAATAGDDEATGGPVVRGSVRELVRLYRQPPANRLKDPEAETAAEAENRRDGVLFGYDYASLKPKTKKMYDAALDYIERWIGPLPVRAVTEAIVLERLKAIANQRHAKGPFKGKRKIATANGIGRIGRMLWHASRTLVAPSHPAYVGKAANPWAGLRARERRERPTLWTREARDLIIAAARKLEWESIACAVIIEWWIGQREADILALGANFNPAALLEVVQGKTAGHVSLPVALVPEIADAVDRLRADQRARKLAGIKLLVDERNGLLWDEHRFRKAFQEVRACAIEEAQWCIRHRAPGWEGRDQGWIDKHLYPLTFMRLRHTVVTMLYRAGATIPEIAAITGHTIGSVTGIIERYGLRDEITAGNGLQKRLDRENA